MLDAKHNTLGNKEDFFKAKHEIDLNKSCPKSINLKYKRIYVKALFFTIFVTVFGSILHLILDLKNITKNSIQEQKKENYFSTLPKVINVS